MSIEPSVYVDLAQALIEGVQRNHIPVGHAAQLLYEAAQPEAQCDDIDILDEMKAYLSDWTEDDLAAIHELRIMQVTLKAGADDDPDERHIAQIVRMATRHGWHWSQVHASRMNLDDGVTEVGLRHLPVGSNPNLILSTGPRGFGESMRKRLTGDRVEEQVKTFRQELDDLFPTTEEGG